MKKHLYSLLALAMVSAVATSCDDLLELDSKTSITNSWLYETPEGLSRAVTALYDLDRNIALRDESSDVWAVTMLDYCTDLMVFRAGTAAAQARLVNLTPSNGCYSAFWNHHYNIIGKANEIIAAAEAMDLSDPTTAHAYGQAKFFRGRAYFELWKRFERLYLNTDPTAVDNLDREFVPASTADIWAVIRDDMDKAIEYLDWALPEGASATQYGRVTKGVAMHVRAQAAMWEATYEPVGLIEADKQAALTKAITLCEEILSKTEYHKLEKKPSDVFITSEQLRSKEVLWAYQFSQNLGGGASGSTTLTGHRYSLVTTANYAGLGNYFVYSAELGGYGWGRVYPNSYLLGLFDQEKDTRYQELIRTEWICNKPGTPTYGQPFDMEEVKGKSSYISNMHPSSLKYYECWSNADQPDQRSSFKDLSIYRLGETVLMCAEAYYLRDGAGSTRALELYNMTYERAGNKKRIEPLDDQALLDEYARECHFEGVRWGLLKRWGLLAQAVKAHGGDTKAEDPYLDKDYNEPRKNYIEGRHEIWPIPQEQIDLMGDSFPQHDAWL